MSDDAFAWDSTGPLHAARCDRLSTLLEAAGPRGHFVPEAVAGELAELGQAVDADLLTVRPLDAFHELASLVQWQLRLGSDPNSGANVGESHVAALAETAGMVPIVDDRKARAVMGKHGLRAHGVLWAISRAAVEGRVPTPNAYSGLCDQMLSTGIRWEFQPGGYVTWFERNRKELAS